MGAVRERIKALWRGWTGTDSVLSFLELWGWHPRQRIPEFVLGGLSLVLGVLSDLPWPYVLALVIFMVGATFWTLNQWKAWNGNSARNSKTYKEDASADSTKGAPFGTFGDLKVFPDSIDFGENFGGRQAVLKVETSFTFAVSIPDCAIGVACVYARRHEKGYSDRTRHSWRVFDGKRVFPGEEERILIAYIANDPGHHGQYGDFDQSRPRVGQLFVPSDHVVTIRVEAGDRNQTKRLLIRLPATKIFMRENGQANYESRFLLQEEGLSIFSPSDIERAPDS